MIPVMRPRLPQLGDVTPYIKLIDSSGIYSNFGPLSMNLESRYAKYFGVGADRVVACGNATLGIHGALSISPLANWLIPDYTFVATASAALSAGKNVSIGEVDLDDWQLSVQANAISDSTGLIPVMPFGAPINLKKYQAFEHVVIDAAASLGAVSRNLGDLPSGWAVVFSLHATKVLGAGEGGIVVFGSGEQARKFRSWMNFGFSGSRIASTVGANAKLSEISAAYALASLDQFENESKEWVEMRKVVKSCLENSRFDTIANHYTGFHPYWIIQCQGQKEKDQIGISLKNQEIDSRDWWTVPISKMPAFSEISRAVPTPNSEQLAINHLGLPFFRDLGVQNLIKIADILLSFE